MKPRFLNALMLVLALLLALATPAKADGIIIPRPCEGRNCPTPFPLPMAQLDIRYHHVKVEIADQLATTHVDQVFYNPNDYAIEGTYVFPLPLNAAINQFVLWVDGKPVEGKVLSAEEARRIYEDTVRQLRDPALLEYVGRGAVQASVFPIPPQGERRIELEYTQVLTAENGLVSYVYPLNTEKFSAKPLESVSVTVNIRSARAIRAVYSSSHNVSVDRSGEYNASASYEASNITPDTDFNLFYSIGESEAFHLFSYRDPGDPQDPDGYFLMLLAPKPGASSQVVAKDVLIILDRSGSMEGEKFQQAQAALRYILQHLNPEDRFHLLSFSSDMQMYAPELRPASEAAQALDWAGSLSAAGSTDINRALLESAGVAGNERPTYLIFITDGLPTEGVTDSQEILKNFQAAASGNLRLFAFGVGYDVDTYLLDSLSQEHHGLSSYVQPGQALDEVLSGFYTRISTPVLTDIQLDFGSLKTYDLYPSPLPDLFSGSQVVVVGRYREGGEGNIRLKGLVNGQPRELTFEGQALVADSRSVRNAPVGLPRLWATRKIGALLNQIRLKGPNQEIIDQIVKLSVRYGIVTPYTSYLVTEPMPLTAESQRQAAQDTYNNLLAQPTAPASGAAAVQKAAGEGAMAQAEAPAPVSEEVAQRVKAVGTRTFVLNEGVWTDTTYDLASMPVTKVSFLSEDYFALANSRPELADAFAVGERVIVVVDGRAYEVVPEGETVTRVEILPTTPPPEQVTPEPPLVTPPSATPLPESTPVPTSPAAKPGPSPTFYLLSCLGGLLSLGVAFWAFRKK